MSAARFSLGRVVATPAVLALLPSGAVLGLLARHARGDWGDALGEDDRRANDEALRAGERLFSSYLVAGEKVWIITERDRSVSTILLPSDY